MVANLQKKNSQSLPTVQEKPVESDTFVNILLARIDELEKKLKSKETNGPDRNIHETSFPSVHSVPNGPKQPIKTSKSTPEVIVKI